MGWEDRDYARPQRPRTIFGSAEAGGIPLIGGSIVTTLIAVNVAVSLLVFYTPIGKYLYGAFVMRPDLVQKGQLWRLVTAQYLHAGWGHLLLNMIGLHFLGRALEQIWSVRRFMFVYTLCGAFGYIFYTFIVEPTRPAVGASGSLYGLLGIVAVMFPAATVYVYGLFPIRIRTAAVIFGLISFFSIQMKSTNFGGEACHLAGLIFGVWWGMRGDEWWSHTEWRFLPHSRPRVRATVHSAAPPGPFAKSPPRSEDQATVDRILAKIGLQGMDSLSDSEKSMLKDATERLQGRRG